MRSRMSVPPWQIQLATLCWVTAASAGAVETVNHSVRALLAGADAGTTVAGFAVQAVAFSGVLAVAGQLWNGRNWARLVLAVLVGGVSTATLVDGPMSWVLSGAPWPDLDPTVVSLAAIRALHITAVWAAVLLTLSPAAGAYVRATAASAPGRR
jgi:hypothetical protein